VRNKGTLGGNIAHADPASDLPAVLCAVAASIHLQGPGGARTIAAGNFFVDLLETAMHEDEILVAVEISWRLANSGTAYLKFEHPASGYAICGAAAVVRLADDGTCASASLSFNGITTTPHNATAVCDAIVGTNLDAAAVDSSIASLTVEEPLSDVHASGEYRSHLAKVFGKRALLLALERARN